MKQAIKTCVFPVAGLGSRFLPATKAIAKEMLIVLDKPLIQYAVEEAKQAGIEKFIFITSQGKSAIEDHFDSSPVLEETLIKRGKLQELQAIKDATLPQGAAIYVRQPYPLGLGHAVLCAEHLITEDHFAVILPDDLVLNKTSCLKQMIDNYQTEDGNMVGVMQVETSQVNRYGVLDILSTKANKVMAKGVIEKPEPSKAPSNTAIIGRYILEKNIFKHLKTQKTGAGGEIQLTDAIAAMLKAENSPNYGLCGFKFAGIRYDCGTKQGWLEANIAFATQDELLKGRLSQLLCSV